ncbi:MAG: ABC transporter ATP-binding protein [Clostridia bacterium]|nr:ABC transporter ATP-binding protein [Clostridia bacterium]
MEEKKPLFGSGSTGNGTNTGSKRLIFSNKNASFGRKTLQEETNQAEPPAPPVPERPAAPVPERKPEPPVMTAPERPAAPAPERKPEFPTGKTAPSRVLRSAADNAGTFAGAPIAPRPEWSDDRKLTLQVQPEKKGSKFGVIGSGTRLGVVGGEEQRTSRVVFSNRKNKPVISSSYFISINGNGETRILPVLNGMLIGSVWANSTVPDIPLSADADRKQGEVFLEDGRIWLRNYSKRCVMYLNDEQPATDRFELRFGDIVRIHSAFDLARANDTVLILVDRIPEGMTWDRIPVNKNANETIQLVREGDPTMQSVFFSYQKGRFAVSHFSRLTPFAVNNRVGELNRPLSPMDVVIIDGTYFICVGNALVCQTMWKRKTDPARKPPVVRPGGLQINIRERTVRKGLSRKEALLRDIRLFIPKGNLVLILGGSGAGKTTFINAVMGYEPANGVIKYDDIDIYREYDKMKHAIGYVQQEDLLRRTDVVKDTLEDSAKMHLGNSRKAQSEAVAETMKLLGLEKEKDKLVGQLSGGQRKRLSIGVEYVGQPLLFFLDEPDSGLDGSNADNMWDIVRKIADTGKIVMVISHIPDRAFDQFDKVIVLAKDKNNTGRLAFAGTPQEACAFFETDRLEDIVKRVNRVNEGGEGRADEFISRFAEAGYGRQ